MNKNTNLFVISILIHEIIERYILHTRKMVKIMHLKMIVINNYYKISYFVACSVCTMMTPRLRLCVREGNYNEDQN